MMNAAGSATARPSPGAGTKLRAGEGTGSHSWHFTKAPSSGQAPRPVRPSAPWRSGSPRYGCRQGEPRGDLHAPPDYHLQCVPSGQPCRRLHPQSPAYAPKPADVAAVVEMTNTFSFRHRRPLQDPCCRAGGTTRRGGVLQLGRDRAGPALAAHPHLPLRLPAAPRHVRHDGNG